MRTSLKTIYQVALATTALTLAGCDNGTSVQRRPGKAAAQRTEQVAPSRTGFANVNRGRFYYEVFGDLNSGATPLLVLHGSYMSSEAMAPLIQPLVASRPVIAFDARGHGRTGDLPGGITYDQLADDAAGLLDALHIAKADVLGYSLGGVTAIKMAVRHPAKVAKQVIVSGAFERGGWYPEVNKALAQATPEAFAGGPLEAAYKRQSPTPNAFPILVNELRDLEASNYDSSEEAVRRIQGKTMIIAGDADAIQFEHAIKLFRLRGGGNSKIAAQGFLPESPRARLAILPATSHVGIMANGELIAQVAKPFLDDTKPALPQGFFKGPTAN